MTLLQDTNVKKDYTDITILLDRSGSMDSIKSDMVGGIRHFIEEQKKLPGECRLTLIQFDNPEHGMDFNVVFTAKPLSEVHEIDFQPRGLTPLLDAVGRAINETGARYKAVAEADRPEFVIFLIITDGYENASHEYTRTSIREMIKHQTEKYRWHFSYLGANQDAYVEAAHMGIKAQSALTYQANQDGVQAMYSSVSNATSALRSRTCSVMSYSSADRQAQNNSGGK